MKLKSGVYLLFVTIVLIAVTSCTIKEPQMPSWDITLNLPLNVFEYSAMDLVEDSTVITVNDADSMLMLDISGDIEKQSISASDLAIAGVDSSTSMVIDTIRIDSLDLLSVPSSALTLGILDPSLYDYVGETISIPAASPALDSIVLLAGDFDSIHVISGTLRLRVTNNLPVPILGSSVIDIYSHPKNLGADSLLAQIVIGEDIQPGESLTKSSEILYPWVINPVVIVPSLETGDSPEPVNITTELLDNASVGLSLKFLDLAADQATGKLSAHEYVWEKTIAVTEDSSKIYSGEIEHGRLSININNQMSLFGEVEVIIWNLVMRDGSPFVHTLYADSNSVTTDEIILDGLRVLPINDLGFPDENSDKPIDSVHYRITLRHEKFENSITLKAPDSVSATLTMDSIFFRSLRGEIPYTELEIEPMETESINAPDELEGDIEFRNLRLILNLNNDFDLGNIDFLLNLKAYKEENGIIVDSVIIVPLLSDSILPGANRFVIGDPEDDPVLADKIADLVNMMPDRIIIDGRASIEGMVNIALGQGIWGDYIFSAPIEIRLAEQLNVLSETDTLTEDDITEEIRDAITNGNIKEIELFSKVENTLPLGGKIILCFDSLNGSGDLFDTTGVPLYINMDHLIAAETDNEGFTDAPIIAEKFIILNEEQLQLFANPPLRMGYKVLIDSTTYRPNDGYVKLQSFHYTKISGTLKFELRVDEEAIN